MVSPLQMAVAYAPFSNGGVSITPVLATAYRYAGKDWKLFTEDETPALLPSMNTDSASAALSSPAIPGWSISSTATTASTTVNWYIAGTQTEWQGTPIVLVVALENSNAKTAESYGQDLFNTSINSVK
jgi:membrane peptidoglycan carboxypeptidase